MRSLRRCTWAVQIPLLVLAPAAGPAGPSGPGAAPRARGAALQVAAADTQTQPASAPSTLYAAGRRALAAGNAAEAVALLARAVARYPERTEYALKLTEAYIASGRPRAAIRTLENLAALHRGEPAIALALARLHVRRQAWEQVAATLRPLEARLDPAGRLLLARACRKLGERQRAARVIRRGLDRLPRDEPLWLALVDLALDEKAYTTARARLEAARRRLGRSSPELDFRAAQIYFHLGQVLGASAVRAVPGGRAGQFRGRWLLVEKRPGAHRFLCCPPASALYQIRRALDAGLDQPEAHVLHARIWQRAGRPAVGLAILQSREAMLLESADPDVTAALAELAFDADALDDFLRYSRLRAARQPRRARQIMADACLALAERYNQRGQAALSTEFLRRALELRPARAELLLRLADADWAANRRQEAIRWYRRALRRNLTRAQRRRALERLAAGGPASRGSR